MSMAGNGYTELLLAVLVLGKLGYGLITSHGLIAVLVISIP